MVVKQLRIDTPESRFAALHAALCFLNRRYRHVEIVFIRYTDRAEEVDEETFLRGPASGGTMVSGALQVRHEIDRSRFRPSDWNTYADQA